MRRRRCSPVRCAWFASVLCIACGAQSATVSEPRATASTNADVAPSSSVPMVSTSVEGPIVTAERETSVPTVVPKVESSRSTEAAVSSTAPAVPTLAEVGSVEVLQTGQVRFSQPSCAPNASILLRVAGWDAAPGGAASSGDDPRLSRAQLLDPNGRSIYVDFPAPLAAVGDAFADLGFGLAMVASSDGDWTVVRPMWTSEPDPNVPVCEVGLRTEDLTKGELQAVYDALLVEADAQLKRPPRRSGGTPGTQYGVPQRGATG